METSNVVYEIHCNNYFKTYTGKTGRKLKERMKEHKNDGEKSRKDKTITGLSQNMKTTGHFPAWDEVEITYDKKNLKKRKFKEAARITSHNKEQLMNKKDERKTISNLWKIVSNNKTSWNLNVMRELNYHFKKLVIYIMKKKSIFSSLNDDLTKIRSTN